MRRRALRPPAPAGECGFTLVELLVALVVAGIVLSACYGWLWSVASLARAQDDRAQAGTIAAAAARAIASDVRAAVTVVPALPAGDAARALSLIHDHVGVPRERVDIVWDPARRVVWRNASGTYLADHVTGFAISYALRDGRELGGEALRSGDWPLVSGVLVRLSVSIGTAQAVRSVYAEVGP